MLLEAGLVGRRRLGGLGVVGEGQVGYLYCLALSCLMVGCWSLSVLRNCRGEKAEV